MMPITISCCDRLDPSRGPSSRRLAGRIRQQLVCRTTTQADEPIVVADISLTPTEAWRLVDKLEGSPTESEINWSSEGF